MTTKMLKFLVVSALLVPFGCAEPRDTAPVSGSPEAGAPVTSTTPQAPATDDWVVTPTGAGHLRIGMTWPELLPLLTPSDELAFLSAECDYAPVADAPANLSFMIVDHRLVRIDVSGGPIATEAGARIGDSEDRIRSLYPGIRSEPHKYTTGRYLIALPLAPADTMHRIVFETNGERVMRYRAGVYPQIEWVEGCA